MKPLFLYIRIILKTIKMETTIKKDDWVLCPLTKDDIDNPTIVAIVDSVNESIINIKLSSGDVVSIPKNYCRVVKVQDVENSISDIKYLGIPNICFSLINKDDNRDIEYSKQRKLIGFDDSETWSLTDTICHFIIPRLKRFKEVNDSCLNNMQFDEWNIIIDKMINSFELICRNNGVRIWSEEEKLQIDDGLDLFRDYFLALWW